MKNGVHSALPIAVAAAAASAVLCLFTGCGGCASDAAKEAAREAAEDVRRETREQTQKLQEELDEAARRIRSAQEEINSLKTDHSRREEAVEKWWRYAKLFLCLIGVLTCLKLLGKPLVRVTAALLLRLVLLKPRQIIESGPDETGLEQT